MNDQDLMLYGALTPTVKAIAGEMRFHVRERATQIGLLPGTVGEIVVESATLLSWITNVQERLEIDATLEDVKEIINFAMGILRRKTDLPMHQPEGDPNEL